MVLNEESDRPLSHALFKILVFKVSLFSINQEANVVSSIE